MKLVSLLSLLFLWSSSCLAYQNAGMHAQSGMAEGLLTILSIGLVFFFLAHFFLLACYQYLIIKNKQVNISTLLKASTFNCLVWGSTGFGMLILSDSSFNIALRPFYALLNLTGPIIILILMLIAMVITAMPLYTFLFLRKKQ